MTELLAIPPTLTTTGPVVAPIGTGAVIVASFQIVGEAVVPLKVSVLFPCVLPNPEPIIFTMVPATPEEGLVEVIVGTPREKFTVVVLVADTKFPGFVTGGYPVPTSERS